MAFNYAPLITHLKEIIRADPRPTDQTDEARAFHVLTRLIERLDREMASRPVLPQPKAFYSFFEIKTQVEHLVNEEDLKAFAHLYHLNADELLKVGLGELKEHKGFVRGKHIHSRGKPYKPPREIDQTIPKKLEELKKVNERLKAQRYSLPPQPTTVRFNPNNKESEI